MIFLIPAELLWMPTRTPHTGKLPRYAILLLVGIGHATGMARAATDDLTSMSLEQLMNEPVISVSKSATKLNASAAAIAVVTHEDIERLGIVSLPEALRLVPGVDVAQISSNQWAISARGFNDEFGTKLLVLVDGRSVYTPATAGVFWNAQDVMIEDVERIEVIRGPGAALWGANAVNGVINIITKGARDTQGSLVSASAASDSNYQSSARYGGALSSDAGYRIYAKYLDQGAYTDSSGTLKTGDWHTIRTGFRVDWDASPVDKITLQGDAYAGTAENDFLLISLPAGVRTDRLDQDASGSNLIGRWTHTFAPQSSMSLQTYYDHTDQGYDLVTEHRDTYDIDFQYDFLWNRHKLVWGTGSRLSRIDEESIGPSQGFSPEFRSILLFHFFLQDEYVLVPNRLRLTVGSKFEHTNLSGWDADPTVRLAFTATDTQTLWSAVSRATRTPSFVELDGTSNFALLPPSAGGPPGLVVLGSNPNLKSEQLVAYEVGYRLAPTPTITFDMASFLNRYAHGIIIDTAPLQFVTVPSPHIVVPLLWRNALDAKTYGAEVEARWQALPNWRLAAAYTWLHFEAPQDRALESSSPEGQLQLRSDLDLPWHLEFNSALEYVGSTVEYAGNISIPSPAYVRADLGFLWKPNSELSVGVWGKNLFEPRHTEFASPNTSVVTEIPRLVLGKVTWSF